MLKTIISWLFITCYYQLYFTVNPNYNRIVKIDALIWFSYNYVAVRGLLIRMNRKKTKQKNATKKQIRLITEYAI